MWTVETKRANPRVEGLTVLEPFWRERQGMKRKGVQVTKSENGPEKEGVGRTSSHCDVGMLLLSIQGVGAVYRLQTRDDPRAAFRGLQHGKKRSWNGGMLAPVDRTRIAWNCLRINSGKMDKDWMRKQSSSWTGRGWFRVV